MKKSIDPRKMLYSLFMVGALMIFSGLTIHRGDVAHLIFGGMIGLGAFLMLAGLMISFFKEMRQRTV